jgi:hypothetical protein
MHGFRKWGNGNTVGILCGDVPMIRPQTVGRH